MAAGTPTPEGHYVKRVTLPSGKTIDVVYFESARIEAEQRAAGAPGAGPPHLRRLRLGARLPHRVGRGRRRELARIAALPELRVERTGVFSQDRVDDFDEVLDEGTEQLVSDLKQLMHANMSEEIDRFVTALDAEAILPEDF